MKIQRILLILILFIMMPCFADDSLEEWRNYLQRNANTLRQWIFAETREALGGEKNSMKFQSGIPGFYGSAGLFITFRTGRSTRGCYGAFYHKSPDPEKVLKDYIRGALRRDPRYEPLLITDIDTIEIILTIAAFPEPSAGIAFIDTRCNGVMIQYEDVNMAPLVFVPGELANNGRIEEFTRGRPCQLFTFEAVTLKARQQ